jgi:hypothetical protein
MHWHVFARDLHGDAGVDRGGCERAGGVFGDGGDFG